MLETTQQTVELDLEEASDLMFKVRVEGAGNSPAKVRLVCEGPQVAYMFNATGTNEPDVVQFNLPAMNNKLQEGTYQARIEVLVENRYFSPVTFNISFKKAMKVVAESIVVKPKAKPPEISVSVAPILVKKPEPVVSVVSESSAEKDMSPLKKRFLEKQNLTLSEEVKAVKEMLAKLKH